MSNHSPFDLVVHGDLVVPGTEVIQNGFLGVRDGQIAALSREPLATRHQVDATGKLVLPGVVDAHVHTRSNPDEGITATTWGAAAGGTTTIIDMPFDTPARPVRTVDALAAKIEDVGREACVDVALYATFGPEDDLAELPALVSSGACGFKVSVYGVDDVRFPRIPDHQLLWAFEEIARLGVPVAAHQENQEIVDASIQRESRRAERSPIDHARSRPAVAETEAAGRLLEFARWTGARLHMVHGTVPRTFDLIEWHRGTGTAVSGETCVQYLTLTRDALAEQGARAKCNPPLRTQEDLDALWAYVERGAVDIVTSDHAPYSLDAKRGDIFEAPAGMPGVETLLGMMYSEGVATGRLTLGRMTELLSSEPAEIFGLHQKGRLEIGRDADFVVFDPAYAGVLDETNLYHRSGWSPFHGRAITGRVEATYVRGKCVFDGVDVVAEPGLGIFVAPTGIA